MNLLLKVASLLVVNLICLEGRLLTENEKQFMLNIHNYYRAHSIGDQPKPPSNMIALEWDDVLAQTANDYAVQCKNYHNSVAERIANTNFDAMGQNYAGNYGLKAAVDDWMSEAEYYIPTTDECTNTEVGYSCGHYKMLMYHNASLLGCAVMDCQSVGGYPVQLWCHYYDQGNYVGVAPYESNGLPCSQCPASHPHCVEGLCTRTLDQEVSFDLSIIEDNEFAVAPGEENACQPPVQRESHDCVFPFNYNGIWYTNCDTSGWCAKNKYYDNNFAMCIIHAKKCVFPFNYNGKSYDSCVKGRFGIHWCSENANDTTYWHYCE